VRRADGSAADFDSQQFHDSLAKSPEKWRMMKYFPPVVHSFSISLQSQHYVYDLSFTHYDIDLIISTV